jgi:hypothetical protein
MTRSRSICDAQTIGLPGGRGSALLDFPLQREIDKESWVK